jgi:radical SAM protein with 4Fe4S-binding SPASM domain
MSKEFAFQWHITDLCNLRCKHCYQERFDRERDLSLKEWDGIISSMVSSLKDSGYDSLSINVTGGEPLISPLLFPILNILEATPFISEFNIITNGILLKDYYQRLKSFERLKYLKVSLEGPDASINDRIRGRGNFQRVIEVLKETCAKDVILMFTLAKYNYRELDKTYILAKDLGIKGFILERFIPLGEGREIQKEALDAREWYEVIDKVSSWLDINPEDLISYKAFFIDLEEGEIMGAFCNLGDESMCLMPDASVYPCRRLPIVLGNLKEEDFSNILLKLRNFRAQFDRKKLKGRCHLCEVDECIGCRALVYALSGDLFDQDPQCWKTR